MPEEDPYSQAFPEYDEAAYAPSAQYAPEDVEALAQPKKRGPQSKAKRREQRYRWRKRNPHKWAAYIKAYRARRKAAKALLESLPPWMRVED